LEQTSNTKGVKATPYQKKSNPNQMRQASIKREMAIKRMRCPDMGSKSPEIVDFAIVNPKNGSL
jgi:hypothetical protein